jgi:hypothetical protein
MMTAPEGTVRRGTARRRTRHAILAVVLILSLRTASVTPEQQFDLHLSPVLDGWRFDWIGWEANAIGSELGWYLQGRALPGDTDSQRVQVLSFLARQQRARALQQRLTEAHAETQQLRLASPMRRSGAEMSDIAALRAELGTLQCEQAEAVPFVERIVSDQVSRALVARGLGSGETIWPPVAFRFTDMPTYLVISPRDEIEIYRGTFLLPGVDDAERVHLESTIEADHNVSALLEDVGGIGCWPTMVMHTDSLRDLLDTVAHEWVHTYLFFRPLGIHYDASRDLTTMNETVASIVGAEVAQLVMTETFSELAVVDPNGGDDPKTDEFSLAMRRIRLALDKLLAAGKVVEAERFMEAERQSLVSAGFHLRRLNQAYFAFHGSYAAGPASVDPIGLLVRQLRMQSDSLGVFLEQVAQMQSLDDLLRAVGDHVAITSD